MFATEDDNKPSPMHVEAGTCVISGRGFNSRRLHCARKGTQRNLLEILGLSETPAGSAFFSPATNRLTGFPTEFAPDEAARKRCRIR